MEDQKAEEINLSADEEAALDRAWERLSEQWAKEEKETSGITRMISVRIIGFDTDAAEEKEFGTISWDGASLVVKPENDPTMRGILNDPAVLPFNEATYSAKTDPVGFLTNLCKVYKSAYLRATEPVET